MKKIRNPIARDLHDPKYRKRVVKDKRREALRRACRSWQQSSQY